MNSTIAAETVTLRQVEIEVKTAQCDMGDLYHKLLEEKEKLVAPEVHFGPRDRQAILDNLEHQEQRFQKELKEATDRLAQNESQQQVDLAKLTADHAEATVVTAATAAYRRARSVICQEIVLLQQRLTEMTDLKDLVNCREELAKGSADSEALHDLARPARPSPRRRAHQRTIAVAAIGRNPHRPRHVVRSPVNGDAKSTAATRPWLDLIANTYRSWPRVAS